MMEHMKNMRDIGDEGRFRRTQRILLDTPRVGLLGESGHFSRRRVPNFLVSFENTGEENLAVELETRIVEESFPEP